MRQRLAAIVRWTFGLLALLAVGAAVASGWCNFVVHRSTTTGSQLLGVNRGIVMVSCDWHAPVPPEALTNPLGWSLGERGHSRVRPIPHWNWRAFRWRREAGPIHQWIMVMFPFWVPAAALLPVAAGLWVRPIVGWRRRRRGACVACGYDRRGIEGACPECGGGRTVEEKRS